MPLDGNPTLPVRASDVPTDRYCLKCGNKTLDDGEGYSICHGVSFDLNDNGDFILKSPPDPADGRNSSQYRGLTKVARKGKDDAYRVQLSRNRIKYYVGEYKDERSAAHAYDNAVVYLLRQGNFFRPGYAPALNFPEHYKPGTDIPGQFKATQKLIRRLQTETACDLNRLIRFVTR